MTTQNIIPSEQLVPVFTAQIGGKSVQACDLRVLHTYLGVTTKFADWVNDRIDKYEFVQNQDFILISEKSEIKAGRGGDRRSKDYHSTLGMAKELAMVENNAKGREVRRYFIAMEKHALETSTVSPLTYERYFVDLNLPDFTNPPTAARAWADMVQIQVDTAQIQANKARAWADDYERDAAASTSQSPPSPPPSQPQSLIPPREIAFIQAWWDCLGSQTVTASDLYRAVATKQCQELNDKSSALLGDISQWTPKKLSHALRRWSQTILNGYAVQNIGRTSHGILWRLQLLLT